MMLALAVLLPLGLGAFFAAWPRPDPSLRRGLAAAGALWLLAVALWLLTQALSGAPAAVAAGGWPAPWGIVLVADALAALLLALTALLALAALAHAAATDADRPLRSFHALFQCQLFGIAGALLAGDLFNLFVFFEVLLLASYGLLLSPQPTAGHDCPPAVALHYVLLNLIGSTLFLLAVALVYAAAGTLNMAHLSARLGALAGPDQALAGAGLLLLATVLALKAALLPLLAWLPGTYAAAPAASAALFTVLTKVGVYGLVRLWTLTDGSIAASLPGVPAGTDQSGAAAAHPVAALLGPLLLAAALGTLAAGAVGALAASAGGMDAPGKAKRLLTWLLPVSVGTMLLGIAAGGAAGLAAALYYLVQSTLVTAGLFLLADLLPATRPASAPLPRPAPVLGALFLLGAVAIIGMPPLSGFVGKALVLTAVGPAAVGAAETASSTLWPLLWSAVLLASLLLTLALARTGIGLFWQPAGTAPQAPPPGTAVLLPAAGLLCAGPLLVVLAGPAMALANAVAAQASSGRDYAAAVAALAAESHPAYGRHQAAGAAASPP